MCKQDKEKLGLVICGKVENVLTPANGSIIEKCVDCKIDVWVSPSTLVRASADGISQENIKPYCIDCAEKEINKFPEHEVAFLPITSQQMKEIKKTLGI